MLTIVATPIGNLKDITLRALETLQKADGIICEDSRRASILLNHYQIRKPFLVLNDFNESQMVPKVLERLQRGEKLALISDAGTPLISDPGYKVVRLCLKEGIEVDSLPGPVAAITALTLSGLPPDKFIFLGYLPDKPGSRQKSYKNIKDISLISPFTLIFYIAPFKLVKTLTEMQDFFDDVPITLAKELTKIYQKVETKLISQWLEEFKTKPPKGEWILLMNYVNADKK